MGAPDISLPHDVLLVSAQDAKRIPGLGSYHEISKRSPPAVKGRRKDRLGLCAISIRNAFGNTEGAEQLLTHRLLTLRALLCCHPSHARPSWGLQGSHAVPKRAAVEPHVPGRGASC